MYLGRIALSPLPTAPGKVFSVGNDNCDFVGTNQVPLQAAHDALPDNGGMILISSGSLFTLTAPVNITKPNVAFVGSWGSRLIALNGQSTSLFNVTAAGFLLDSLWLYCDVATANQAMVRFSSLGVRSTIRGTRFEWALTGDDANPMIGPYYDTTALKYIDGCTFLPARGVSCVYAQNGRDLRVRNSEFTNGVDGETTYVPRLAWRCIHVRHDGWADIQGCNFWGLALPAPFGGPEGDAVVLYEHDSTQVTKPEAGHLRFRNNMIEGCSFSYFGRFQGLRWGQFTGNFFGTSNRAISGVSQAALSFLSENGIGGGQFSDQILVGANQFHNCAEVISQGGVGNALYASATSDLSILGNQFSNMQMPYVCEFNTGTCSGLVIDGGNTFAPGIEVPTAAIRLSATAAAKYRIGSNTVRGFAPISKAGGVTGNVLERGITNAYTAEPSASTTFAAGANQAETFARLT